MGLEGTEGIFSYISAPGRKGAPGGQTRTCDLCVRFSHGDFALLRYAPAAPHSAHTLLVLCSDFTHDMLVICSHGAHLLLAAQSLSGSVLR